MSLINRLSQRLQRHPKRVVFPEGNDPRILQAARQFATRQLGVPMLIGDRTEIREKANELGIRLDDIRIVETGRSDDFDEFVRIFSGLQRFGGLSEMNAEETLRDPNYFAAMMVATGRADAMLSGATTVTASGLRAILNVIPKREGVSSVSSLQFMEFDKERLGREGVLFMSDCAVIHDPTDEQLVDIALTTAGIAYHLTNETPRIAMLSHVTKSQSTKSQSVRKMKIATQLAREAAKTKHYPIEIDGEMQVDVALSPIVANLKGWSGSPVAGKANVLIFPDIQAAHISSKMFEVLAGVPVYGQILTGLKMPCAEISRGASAHDIFGTAVLVACQAIDHRLLYGDE